MNLLFKIFGGSYDDLWKALIRPNKDSYTREDLGPIKFEIGDKCYFLLSGKLPPKQTKLLEAWIIIHEEELITLWKLMEEEGKMFKIKPL